MLTICARMISRARMFISRARMLISRARMLTSSTRTIIPFLSFVRKINCKLGLEQEVRNDLWYRLDPSWPSHRDSPDTSKSSPTLRGLSGLPIEILQNL